MFCPTPFFSTRRGGEEDDDEQQEKHNVDEQWMRIGDVRPLRRSKPVGFVGDDCRNDDVNEGEETTSSSSSSSSSNQRSSKPNSLRKFRPVSSFGGGGAFGRRYQADYILKPPKARRCHWKKTKDPVSKKWYYYHEITHETQWEKPIELATGEELDAMLRRVEEQKRFFREMESNVYKTLLSGDLPGGNHPPFQCGGRRHDDEGERKKHDSIFSWSACSGSRYTTSTRTESIYSDHSVTASERSIDSLAWMMTPERQDPSDESPTSNRERRGRHVRTATR